MGEFLFSVLKRGYKRWGNRGVVLLVVAAITGALVGLSSFGFVAYKFAIWQADEHLASANKRADRADETSAAANKRASDAETALQELKTKYDAVNTQNQVFQKAEEIRKRNAALQKTVPKRPKNPILNDLFDDDDWHIIGHNGRRPLDRRYILLATYSQRLGGGGLLGGSDIGCTLTVANVDTKEENKFDFVEGRSGVLSVGETKVTLVLFSATNIGSRSEVCAFFNSDNSRPPSAPRAQRP
jgi:hypothetical protein